MTMIEISAVVICIIFAALTVFQTLLLFGAPLGKYTQGGYHIVLPTGQRIICVISIILYVFFGLIVLNEVGLIDAFDAISRVGIWAITAFFFVGVFMNAISRSKPERNIMTPVASLLTLLSLLIALH